MKRKFTEMRVWANYQARVSWLCMSKNAREKRDWKRQRISTPRPRGEMSRTESTPLFDEESQANPKDLVLGVSGRKVEKK